MSAHNLQTSLTTGRMALPVTFTISVVCWVVVAWLWPQGAAPATDGGPSLWTAFHAERLPQWALHAGGFVLCALMGYFLIGLNNAFGLIRIRASVQTAAYFLVLAACPALHVLDGGMVASAACLVSIYYLLGSYQSPQAAAGVFHAFLYLGVGSLFVPRLTWMVPVLWMGAYQFHAWGARCFAASLLGWAVPWWLLLCYAWLTDQTTLWTTLVQAVVQAEAVDFSFSLGQALTLGYLFVMFAASALHCVATGFDDKIRTRSYLYFFIVATLVLFVLSLLQPALGVQLMGVLVIGVCILTGHLFALTRTRASNVFFIAAIVVLAALFGFNLWTLSLAH